MSAPILRCRLPVSDAILRVRREIDLGTCSPDCGGDLRVVGEDVGELLDMNAVQMKVIQIARIKKSCRRCESERRAACGPRPHRTLQERAPGRPIPSSRAGPNLLAHVLVAKFDAQLLLIANTESSPEWARTFPKAS